VFTATHSAFTILFSFGVLPLTRYSDFLGLANTTASWQCSLPRLEMRKLLSVGVADLSAAEAGREIGSLSPLGLMPSTRNSSRHTSSERPHVRSQVLVAMTGILPIISLSLSLSTLNQWRQQGLTAHQARPKPGPRSGSLLLDH